MYATGTRGGNADGQPATPFSVTAGSKCCGLFVPHLDKPDLLLMRAQGFDYSVDPVTGDTKDRIDSPRNDTLNRDISAAVGLAMAFF
jgi:hypothetical protein